MSYLTRVLNLYINKYYQFTEAEKEIELSEIQEAVKVPVKQNTIALLEPNDYHSECYPSYIKYFLELGFDVHLFTHKKNIEENSLVSCNFPNDRLKIFSFSKFPIHEPFFENLCRYKYIFLATLLCHASSFYAEELKKNYLIKFQKKNLYCINHETNYNDTTINTEKYLINNTFTLRRGINKVTGEGFYPFISPIYFGEFENLIKPAKNKQIVFLNVSGNYLNNMRNYKSLFEAVGKLLDNGYKNFKIIFIGERNEDILTQISHRMLPYVEFTGRVNFKELYRYSIQSDYILFNVDKSTINYDKYLNRGITGSYSLSLGFLRPGIIDFNLAQSYGLNNGCSICYGDNGLFNAIKTALEITDKEYKNFQSNLLDLSKNLQKESLKNIKEIFHV